MVAVSITAGGIIVMFVWTLETLLNPGHGVKVYEHFFSIKGMDILY